MSIRELAESISCDTIKFLDKKYNTYNNYMFKNKMKCKNEVPLVSTNKEKLSYLNSITINKKSCVDLPYDSNEEKELILENNPYSSIIKIPISFNENTRYKLRNSF